MGDFREDITQRLAIDLPGEDDDIRELLLNAARDKQIAWEGYMKIYTDQMRRSWRGHREQWLAILRRDRVVLCCYCTDPERCHRTILAGLLVRAGEHTGLPAEYLGEVG